MGPANSVPPAPQTPDVPAAEPAENQSPHQVPVVNVATSCATRVEFIIQFKPFVDEATLFLPASVDLAVGRAIRFVVSLRDGRTALEGDGEVLEVHTEATGPARRAGLRIRVNRVTDESRALREEMLGRRRGLAPLRPMVPLAKRGAPTMRGRATPLSLRMPAPSPPEARSTWDGPTNRIENPAHLIEAAKRRPTPLPTSNDVVPANPFADVTTDTLSFYIECNLGTQEPVDIEPRDNSGAFRPEDTRPEPEVRAPESRAPSPERKVAPPARRPPVAAPPPPAAEPPPAIAAPSPAVVEADPDPDLDPEDDLLPARSGAAARVSDAVRRLTQALRGRAFSPKSVMSRVGRRRASPAAAHRGRVWEPFQGSHLKSGGLVVVTAVATLVVGGLIISRRPQAPPARSPAPPVPAAPAVSETARPVASPEPAAAPAPSTPTSAGAGSFRCFAAITSRPTGAVVRAGGRPIGSTPLARAEVPCGTSTVVVSHPRYVAARETLTAAPETQAELSVRLVRPRAEVRIESTPPRAVIRVNGIGFGRSPAVVPVLRFERVRIEAALPGHAPFEQSPYLRNPSTTITAKLRPVRAAEVKSRPSQPVTEPGRARSPGRQLIAR